MCVHNGSITAWQVMIPKKSVHSGELAQPGLAVRLSEFEQ